ncbi:type 1 fimbria pilin [Acinetobacter calcoaceticus]|uniref:Type 1 fimbria pilin n=1 Tax=Acinetobacter calcoaceticus TaxID=471 RepID=A0A4R1XA85_ACICA|nr:type 1 fimbria pilin [Acinetobacter calcoaceticus]
MNIKKTVLFTALFTGGAASYACTPVMNPANFNLGGSNLIINKILDNENIRQIAKDARPNPDRYDTIFDKCDLKQGRQTNSFFTFTDATSSLNAQDKKDFPTPVGNRTFLAIKNASYSTIPSGAKPPKVYMSFAVADPKYEDRKIIITTPGVNYRMLKNNADAESIGLVIDKIYLYIITDKDSVPGLYSINNIKIGQLHAETYTAEGEHLKNSPRVDVNISPGLTFQIKQSTCALDPNNHTINLEPILSRKFTSLNQREGMQYRMLLMDCPDETPGMKFNATVSDNGPQARANTIGLLSNQIATAQGGSNVQVVVLKEDGTGVPISAKNDSQMFFFGELNQEKKIHFPFRVGYQATTLPVTPGDVKAVANINIDYD